MKFIIQILTLFAATGVLSSSLRPRDEFLNEETLTNALTEANASKECIEDAKKVLKCIPEFDVLEANIEGLCPEIRSEKCQNIYDDVDKFLPNCKGNAAVAKKFSKELMEFRKLYYSTYCQLDDDGISCASKGICNSKICDDGKISAYRYMISHMDLVKKYVGGEEEIPEEELKSFLESQIEYLNSEECTSQYPKISTPTTTTVEPVPTTTTTPVEPVPSSSSNPAKPIPTTTTPDEPAPSSSPVEPVPTTTITPDEPAPSSSPVEPVPSKKIITVKKVIKKCVVRKDKN